MANTIMIRKAKQNYVCDVCRHIIKEGDEYLDKVILNNGKCVQHERYHDQCPKTSSVERLFCKLEKSCGDLIAANKAGVKIHIVGIGYKRSGKSVILYRDWNDVDCKTMDFSELKNYHDCDGNDLI